MKIKPIVYCLGLLLFLSSHVYGGEDFPDAAEFSGSAERWYRIELLIYRQKPATDVVDEIWPYDLALAYPDTWVKLKTQEEYIANPHPHPVLATWLSGIKTSPYTPFVLQSDSMKSLSKAAKQIQRFEGDVLFHGVWWQPFIQNDSRESPAILIKAGKQYGSHAELEGSISFKLSRYIHMSTNLWWTEFAANITDTGSDITPVSNPWPALPISPDQAPAPLADPTLLTDDASASQVLEPYLPRQVILIKQSRRMRSEETHYIDHPKIGIVVRLTPQPEKK
jgi:hypothetical protein